MTLRSIRPAWKHMGLTYITATVESLDRAAPAKEDKFLVATGAIDCLLPASIMTSAGIKPDGAEVYELADGKSLERQTGWARFNFMDTFIFAKTIFGPEYSKPLLGKIALETAGFIVDPANQTLKRLAVRSLKRVA